MQPEFRLMPTRLGWLACAVVALCAHAAPAPGQGGDLREHAEGLTVYELREAGLGLWDQAIRVALRGGDDADADRARSRDALLEQVAYRLTDARDAPSWRELEQQAADLLDDGADDPHVHGWYAHALAARGDMAAARPHARIAAEALVDDDRLPLVLRALTAQRLGRINEQLDDGQEADEGEDNAEAENHQQQAAHLYVRALAEQLPDDPLQQRVMLQWVRDDCFDRLAGEEQETFHARCVDHHVAPWVVDLLGGIVNLRLGQEITAEHGQGPLPLELGIAYHRHMSEARRHLLDAHRRHPDRPEAASWLITLSARGYAPPGTTHRHWFDNAAAAQFDHVPAYSRMIEALHPGRLGGSRDDVLDFGIECLMTERFDTEVPYQFLRAVEKYVELLGGDYPGAFAKEGVKQKLLWMLESYREQPDRRAELARVDSFIAAVAWRGGRMELAARALAAAGDDVHEAAFERVGAVPERAMGEILARTGPLRRTTLERERQIELGIFDIAIAELDALADRQADRPALGHFFRHLARRTRIQRDLEHGGEADLQPGPELAGWSPMVGDWSVDADGALVGRSTEQGLWITCDVPLGTRFELSAEVEFDLESDDNHPNAGLVFGYRTGEGFHTFLAHHHSGSAQLSRGLFGGAEADAPVQPTSRLRLIVRDRRVYAFVNNRPVFSNEAPQRLPDDDSARIGVGGHYWYPGATVRFRNIRARRIQTETLGQLPVELNPGAPADGLRVPVFRASVR